MLPVTPSLLLAAVLTAHAVATSPSARSARWQSSSVSSAPIAQESTDTTPPTPEVATGGEGATLPAHDFSGVWDSPYGELRLERTGDRVHGSYPTGTIIGLVEEGRLRYQYIEANARGEGWFELSEDGQSLDGRWRQDGIEHWHVWVAQRSAGAPPPRSPLHGLWDTDYGRMRLVVEGDAVQGFYGSPVNTITGELEEGRLSFRYDERTVQGEGWFEVGEDPDRFEGRWREDDSERWRNWTGRRVVPEAGRQWLVVLEAHWERDLAEREYSFGEMLREYFTMGSARSVEVRHRFFHDRADFERFCGEVRYLAEPVVLLISSHGTPQGVQVGGATLDAATIADAVRGCGSLRLLHLSGCSMMAGDVPAQVQSRLGAGHACPISGYTADVAWDASALADFTFLSFLLLRGLDPEQAARQSVLASPYLGHERVPGSQFASLGLTVRMPDPTPNETPDTVVGSPH